MDLSTQPPTAPRPWIPAGLLLIVPLLLVALLPLPAHGAQAEPPGPVASPPYPFTPRHLARVWHHAGDRDLLLMAAGGAAAALLISPWDGEITEWFRDEQPLGDGAVDLGRELGHRKWVTAVSIALAGGGQLVGNHHVRDTGVLYAEANLITAGITELIKITAQRERPDGSNDKNLPSGHASATMASARMLQMRFGWWIGVPAYTAAVFAGLSRLQGNKHFPSDVLLGWTIGFFVSSAVGQAMEGDGGDGSGDDAARQARLSWLPPPSIDDPGIPVLHFDF